MTRKRNYPNPRRDQFADLLAEETPRAEIMKVMGLTVTGYKGHLRALRADLGWQAQ